MEMNAFGRDIRYALRQLRRSPGFALTTVLTLALGVGALTTVATWTNAVLVNPWPQVAAPRTLRFIDATVLGGEGYSVHFDQYQYVRHQSKSFSDAGAFSITSLNLNLPDAQPEAIMAGTVSANYFQLLGLKPQLGRYFDSNADDRAYGAHDEIALSDALWRDRFAADPNVIGRTVLINHHPFNVIGVAPKGFSGIYGGMAEFAWIPLSSLRNLSADAPPDPLGRYGLQVVARLRPGVSDAAAAAELHTLARAFAAAQQDQDKYNGWNLNLRDAAHFQRGLFGFIGQQLPVLFAASGLLIVLVCINIASLLGQHTAKRMREVAIRTALGAPASRIAAQVLVETGILATIGALAGWAASIGLSRALYVLLPNFGMPLAFNLHSDARILLFVTAIAVAVTVTCGMYPIRQALRASQRDVLHEGSAAVAGRSGKRIGQRLILGLQLGICFVVLVGSGLLMRSALNIFKRDVGFNRSGTITAFIDLSRSGYNEQHGAAFQSELLNRLRTAPGVSSATLTSHLPMGDEGSGNTQEFSIPGYVPNKGEAMEVVTDFEGPDFFHAMGIPVVQGREFTTHDDASAPGVAMINEDMAIRYWPHGDAIGRSVVVSGKPWQIVGIVHNFMYHSPDETGPSPLLFIPLTQHYISGVFVAARSRTTASAIATQLRQAVSKLDSSLPLENIQTLEEVSAAQYQLSRVAAELLGVYALASVLVAMLGLYAVMAYSVIERHREFALRMALGSTRKGIFRLVLTGSASVGMVGLVTGGLGSIGAVRLLRATLFNIAPFDPVSYVAAAIVLLLTVFVSGVVPAQRAASIEPMQALRSE
jgi:predicted permease